MIVSIQDVKLMAMKNIIIDGENLKISDIGPVARGRVKVSLGKDVKGRITAARRIVKKAIDEKKVI